MQLELFKASQMFQQLVGSLNIAKTNSPNVLYPIYSIPVGQNVLITYRILLGGKVMSPFKS